MTIYRQATENAAGLQADPTKPRFLHQLDGQQCGISHQCKAVLVIDPEDREQVERLTEAFGAASSPSSGWVDQMQAALRSLLEPEPEEPTGLGAVVRAGDGSDWVRIYQHEDCNDWRRTDDPAGSPEHEARSHWRNIPRPITVLSEGYEESTDE